MREPVICLAYVVESRLIKQNLLEDEGGHSLAQLRPALHDPKAEWNDLGGQKKVDHLLLVRLDEGSDDPEWGETEVLEWSGLADGVEERVEVERDVGEEEGWPGVGVGGDTLEEGESIADPVTLVSSEDGGVDRRVDVNNFLTQNN